MMSREKEARRFRNRAISGLSHAISMLLKNPGM